MDYFCSLNCPDLAYLLAAMDKVTIVFLSEGPSSGIVVSPSQLLILNNMSVSHPRGMHSNEAEVSRHHHQASRSSAAKKAKRSGHYLNFFLFPFCIKSSICLEGKSMTPHQVNTIFFCFSQQLPRLRLGPSKAF